MLEFVDNISFFFFIIISDVIKKRYSYKKSHEISILDRDKINVI